VFCIANHLYFVFLHGVELDSVEGIVTAAIFDNLLA